MPLNLQAVVSVLLLTGSIPVFGQSVLSFFPNSSPVTGQTTVVVHGSDFIKTGPSRSRCYFRTTSSARRSPDTEVINSTFLHCPTPEVPFLDHSKASYVVSTFQITADGNFSSPQLFIFFDLDRITIKAMNPVEGGVATGGVVTIWGEAFVNTREIVCLVNGTRVAIGIFINSTALRCRLPPVYPSRRVTVKISLNDGDATGVIPANDSLTTFTFYHDAPQLISAAFSKSLSTVSLEFELEVEIGGEDEVNSGRSPDCRTVFDGESYRLIGGNDARCYWATQQQRRIIVALPATASVLIGSTLALRGGNIRARWQQYSRLASGYKTVITPFEVQRPVAVIEGPSVIPVCGNVTVTGRNSQGIGYARLTYKWWLSSDTQSALPDLSGNNVDTIQLSSDWFAWNATYAIHLKVNSPLGFESETANYTLTKANVSVPVVEILGPVDRRIHCSNDLFLESKISLPACASQTSIVGYQWTVTEDNGDSVSLDSIPRNTPTLFISHGTLDCNQAYHARVAVQSSDSSQARYHMTDSPQITIRTEKQQLDARIQGGNAWSISELQELVLDGSLSLDPNSIDADAGYDWDCVLYNTTKPCVNASSGDTLMFPQDSTVSIEPGYLHPRQSYLITLNYTKGEQFIVARAVVTVTDQPEEVPVVGLVAPANSKAVNPSEQVTIQAVVGSHFEGTVQWECVSEDPGFGALDLTDPAIVSTPNQYQLISEFQPPCNDDFRKYLLIGTDDDDLRSVFLTLRPHSLLPDIPYRFRLTATNQYGSNYAEVTVKTSLIPSGCIVVVTPATGLALETLFTVQANGCAVESDRYPLVYRYGIKRNGANEIDWLGGPTADSALLTYLPIGEQNNGFELSVYVRVEDNRGVHQTFSSVAVVNPSRAYDLTSLKTRIMEEVTRNWPAALRSLQTVLSTINTEPVSFGTADISSFRTASVNILGHLSNSTLPRRKDELMQLITTLVELTKTNGLENSPDTIITVINLVESAVSDIVLTGGNKQVDFSFTAHEGTQVFSIYNNILSISLEGTARRRAKESFHWSLKTVGFGMCKRQSYGSEKQSAVFALGALQTSVATPLGSHPVGCSTESTGDCPFDSSTSSIVAFGTALASKYSTWSCDGEELCNGVCTVSAQITVNLFEMPSPHDPVRKSDTVSLSLLDPKSGGELALKDLEPPIDLDVKLTVVSERKGVILCVYFDEKRSKWNSDGCNTKVSVPDTERLDVGSIIHCKCNLFSIFLVIERCPPGYYGTQCENTCPQDLWGQDCSNVCDCSSRGPCDPVDGQCDCMSGWIGKSCQNRCTEGYWGKNCSQLCHCQKGALCVPHTGECKCTSGWMGKNCSKSCPIGSYGLHCSQPCQCKNGSNCSAVTGECTCASGFKGTDCSEVCPTWTYGRMCENQCSCYRNGSSHCHHVTGDCTCLEKWNGTFCNKAILDPVKAPAQGFPAWTIGIALIIVILVVAGILVFLYIRKRKHGSMVIHPVEEVDGKEDEEDDEVTITKARSLEFILQTKPGTRERIEWEVAKVKAPPRKKRKSVNTIDEEEDDDPVPEIPPKKIRLPPDGTLADLREALAEENWFEEGTTVKFLLRGDQRLFYSRDQEPVVILAQVFVENGGFRRIYVLEREEVKRRKKSRAVSGRQKNESMRRAAMRNISASSRATRSQTSVSTSYSSYTTDRSYSESFTETEEEGSGSETEETEASDFEGSETGSYTSGTDSSQSGVGSNQERPRTAKTQPSTDRQHSTSSSQSKKKRAVSAPQTSTIVAVNDFRHASKDGEVTDDKIDEATEEGSDNNDKAGGTGEEEVTDKHSIESHTQLTTEPSQSAEDGTVKVDSESHDQE